MINTPAFSTVKYEILKTLQRKPVSRVNLAQLLGLSKPTISDNVSRLMEAGAINEIGEGEARKTGGRKPIILELNPQYQLIAVVDLSFKNPVCAIGDLSYRILKEREVYIKDTETDAMRLDAIAAALDMMIEQLGFPISKLGVIIISTPGIIGEDGDYYFANVQFSKWTNIGLKNYLKQYYQIGVILHNDVNLALTAEMEMGDGIDYKNLIYISCGLGLGSGIAINRNIYQGEHFAAGEIGYFIDEAGLEAGKNLEDQISLTSILEKVRGDLAEGCHSMLAAQIEADQNINFTTLAEAYRAKDEYVRAVIYEYVGKKLGVAIFNIVSLLDLGVVILGGIYTVFAEEILRGIAAVLTPARLKKPELKASKFNAKGSIYGALVEGTEVILKSISQ